jgi:CspA family cold shock protein
MRAYRGKLFHRQSLVVREEISMSDQLQVLVCQRCGRGFVLTSTYLDLLARRGKKVLVPVLCPTCFMKKGPLPKQRGKVKWFNPHKHYGFITTGEGKDVFFHQRQILEEYEDKVHEGQTARFHIRYSPKGPEALNVEMIEG